LICIKSFTGHQLLATVIEYCRMITAPQLRAARALLGMDQRALAKASGLSLPTIQRMEASDSIVRGHVDSLMKLIAALNRAGIELINEGATSGSGGRGVRLKRETRSRNKR
jgi:transcriptional regulator with XRE-family HTH domain